MKLSFFSFLLLGSLFFTLNACQKQKVNTQQTDYEYSSSNYQGDWTEVKKMEQKGLGKAIIEKTDSILERALKEKNAVQIFKAMAYRSKYINEIEEDAHLKILSAYEKQADESDSPLKELFHSATAELFDQYYQQNRWRFQNRSQTEAFKAGDIRTWSLEKIREETVKHYLLSLKNEAVLQATPLEKLEEIIQIHNKSSLWLQPDLFSFLAHRALDYFERNEGKPEAKAIQAPQKYFSAADEFKDIPFEQQAASSNHDLAFAIFQKLLSSEQAQKNDAYFIYYNLKRLKLAKNQVSTERSDGFYFESLIRMSKQIEPRKDKEGQINYALAEFYFDFGNNYLSSQDSIHRHYLKYAYQHCEILERKDNFVGKQAKALIAQILQSHFNFSLHQVQIPEEEIELKINYRNHDKLFFRLYKVEHTFGSINQYQETYIDKLKRQKVEKEWSQALKDYGDYQPHDSTVQLDGLPLGNYFLMASPDSSFSTDNNQVAISNFQVSNLAYFSRQNAKQGNVEIYLRHRKSGEVIQGTKVQLFESHFNKENRTTEWVKSKQLSSDSQGLLEIKQSKNSPNVQMAIYHKEDTLSPEQNYYLHRRGNEKKQVRTHLFSDRAIYRPGQTIYFKGIVLEGISNAQNVKANYDTEINLYNTNGEEIAKQQVKTNDFGSYQGSFTLPSGGLVGQYRLQDKNGMHYFSVEEYKRPTFEVKIDSNKQTVKIHDSVKVSGVVQAFSGAAVGNAEIRYQVVRNSQAPIWPFLSSHFPPISKAIVSSGKLKANASGIFDFHFLAAADQRKYDYNPQHHFEISIWATSPSGEMQSDRQTIKVSKQALFLSTNLDVAASLEEVRNVVVKARNIQGKAINTKAEFRLLKLKAPKEMIEMQKEEIIPFYGKMPNEGSSFLADLKVDYELMKSQVTCNHATNLIRDLKPGAYAIMLESKDRFGETVSFEQRFVLYDENSQQGPLPFFFWSKKLTEKAEVGETASILVSTALKELQLLYEVESQGEIIHSKWMKMSDQQRKLDFTIGEKQRGGISFHLTAVHSNQLIKQSEFIAVPFSNKKLQIELQTFRDLIKPGAKEKWSLQLKDQNGKAVQAEVLAGMYDQSLDVFRSNAWKLNVYNQVHRQLNWQSNSTFQMSSSNIFGRNPNPSYSYPRRVFPELNWFGFYLNRYGSRDGIYAMSMSTADKSMDNAFSHDESVIEEKIETVQTIKEKTNIENTIQNLQIRSDFRETAFFYPHLQTDEEGKVSFEFEMPDALTQWKFQLIAHDKDLSIGTYHTSIRTQKDLMVSVNSPRFVREGDRLNLKLLINNLSEEIQYGHAQLEFFDPISNHKLDLFVQASGAQKFSIPAKENVTKSWSIEIPEGLKAIKYRARVKGENHEDGEEKTIPVLPAKQLITETFPFYIEGNREETLLFTPLIRSKQNDIQPESYTVEVTANPIWQVVQALPYLQSGKANSSDQLFHQYFTNRLAIKIVDEQPKIQEVFQLWFQLIPEELNSELEKNQELKSLMLEETPWLQEAKSESEQKRQIANLFDKNNLNAQLNSSLNELIDWQLPNGAWPWFKGMPESRYTTQIILSGLGHLKALGVGADNPKLQAAIENGLQYLDEKVMEDYRKLLATSRQDTADWRIGSYQIQYLYLRSFYPEIEVKEPTAYRFYLRKAKKEVHQHPLMLKAMLATVFHKSGNFALAKEMLLSIKDYAIESKEQGMYWKENRGGWSWQNEKIESQALLIEAFENILEDKESVQQMKIWLLKNKQVNRWKSSKATAAACYAMLLQGDNWLKQNNVIQLKLDDQRLSTADSEVAGSGYVKKRWVKSEISPEMGEIEIENRGEGVAWGAAYLQYYQSVDQVKESSQSGIKVSKTLFKIIQEGKSEKLLPIEKENLQIGDRIKVRLRLESDRSLSFVHLKDGRASGMEPLNELSAYRGQDGLFYYQSSQDASTHFFFEHLPRGVYIFEYELKTNISGSYLLEPAVFQSYYAPEFQAISSGSMVEIE
ncbi:MAG: alpha-2-macroglobulin family protein [Vicingaceae bacterium]